MRDYSSFKQLKIEICVNATDYNFMLWITKVINMHVDEFDWDRIYQYFYDNMETEKLPKEKVLSYIAIEDIDVYGDILWKFEYIPTPAEKRKAYQKKYYKRNKAKLDEYQENYRKEMKELKKDCLKKIKRTINGNR